MIRLLFLTVCFAISRPVFSQTVVSDTLQQKMTIKSQGDSMCNYFLQRDFKNFIKYTYPALMKMWGGQEKMLAALEKGFKEMDSKKESYLKVEIGEPSTLVSANNELQCTVPQTIELRQATGKAILKTTLIGISIDNGLHWYFVDASNNNLKNMQSYLPNLSNELVIPKPLEPKFIPD